MTTTRCDSISVLIPINFSTKFILRVCLATTLRIDGKATPIISLP